MKKFLFAFFLMSMFGFQSCKSEESEPLVSMSEDQELVITVKGSRPNAMEPFRADIQASIEEHSFDSFVEVYVDKFDAENVKFVWKDNRHCVIQFTQRDGVVLPVPISIE